MKSILGIALAATMISGCDKKPSSEACYLADRTYRDYYIGRAMETHTIDHPIHNKLKSDSERVAEALKNLYKEACIEE